MLKIVSDKDGVAQHVINDLSSKNCIGLIFTHPENEGLKIKISINEQYGT